MLCGPYPDACVESGHHELAVRVLNPVAHDGVGLVLPLLLVEGPVYFIVVCIGLDAQQLQVGGTHAGGRKRTS